MEKMLRELRNQVVSFIPIKFEMSIRYPTVDVDYLVVYESQEFKGIVRFKDIKWKIIRIYKIFTTIRLNGVSYRVIVGKEEKSEV